MALTVGAIPSWGRIVTAFHLLFFDNNCSGPGSPGGQAGLTIRTDARLYGRRHTSVFLHLFGL
jgi:hypothetical protein